MSIGVAVRHDDASLVVDVVDAIDRTEGMHVVPALEDAMVVLAGGAHLRAGRDRGRDLRHGFIVLSAGETACDVRAGFEVGARGWLRWPRDVSDLGRVVALAARDVREPDSPRGRLVAVTGARGGAGASTVACLLAASQEGALIVDLKGDQRGWAPHDAAGGSLARAIAAPIPDVIVGAAEPHAAGRALYGDGSLVSTELLVAVLEAARQVAPLVILDGGRSDMSADRTVLVCADDLASLRAARVMLDAVFEADVVLNRFRRRGIRPSHVERALGRAPIGVIRRDWTIARAADLGILPRRRVRTRVARWLS